MLLSLEHTARQISQGKREQTLELMTSTIEAFCSIEESLPLIRGEDLEKLTEEVRIGFAALVQRYEEQNNTALLEVLVLQLIPAFREWLEGLRLNAQDIV